ncbi:MULTISPECIES: hypothetical protein [Peptostreptococcales]|uniref:hypothetical protein n=1 Tax=Peptostreptococcales TaxID=3082720 RepID=UPI000E4E8EBD|nr:MULTISPECIES: hypothetical protein [Peptostreptococcaceae]QQQ86752.1 hypothetical protein JHD53_01220 [Peptacetobacter hiranonis]RHQ98852.1 hypothetical protein DWX74_03295 [Peptoclostridium sp. AF21-18]
MKLFLKDANDVKLNSPDEVKKITNSFIVSVIILFIILRFIFSYNINLLIENVWTFQNKFFNFILLSLIIISCINDIIRFIFMKININSIHINEKVISICIILLLILDIVSSLIFNKIDYFYIFIDFLFIIGFFTKIINKN